MGGIITVSATSDYMNMGIVFYHGASIGIKADAITIDGVLDTVINNTNDGVDAYGADSIGIYTYNLNASAFTGKITADHGINVRSNGLSGENQIDLFDVAGEIYASRSAIVSAYQTKVRISGIVAGGEYAVRSEYAYDADGEGGWVQGDETALRKLGINITSEPVFASRNIFME